MHLFIAHLSSDTWGKQTNPFAVQTQAKVTRTLQTLFEAYLFDSQTLSQNELEKIKPETVS